jgi:hypothetical protein
MEPTSTTAHCAFAAGLNVNITALVMRAIADRFIRMTRIS